MSTFMHANPTSDSFTDEEKRYIKISSASIASETSSLTLGEKDSAFIPGKTLRIGAVGIGLIRLPLPSKQLQIPVYNSDGSVAYLSTREKVCSSNAVLSHPTAGPLVSTAYFFGPGRDPILTTLTDTETSLTVEPGDNASQIKVNGKWLSRSQTFRLPNGKTFIWRYIREKESEDGNKRKQKVLVLQEKESGRKIAYLERTKETRAPGSTGSSAGNGGDLILALGSDLVLDEALIVATCVTMLKKEIDLRRMVQMAVLVSIISG